MKSLRSQLVLGTALATLAIFAAAAVAIYLLARASLISEFDTALRADANALVSAIEFGHDRVKFESSPGQFPEFAGGKRPKYFVIFAEDGSELSRSDSLQAPDRLNPQAGYTALRLPDGRAGRQVGMRFTPRPEDEENPHSAVATLQIVVARDTKELDGTLARLRWLLAGVCGTATLLLVALGAGVIRRVLRPVDQLARNIGAIGATNLSERLRQTNLPSELSPVVQRLNDLLERLQGAFDRERSFTADAAHELRTPLAGLETALDVGASRDRAPHAYVEVMRECLVVVRGMHAMVENLLLLARADGQRVHITRSAVHLSDLLHQCWQRFTDVADTRDLRVELDIDDSIGLETDRQKLTQILTNLFDNAAHYADHAGRIRIAVQRKGATVQVLVANSGSEVRAEDVGRVFERFWRADASRHETGQHCGLGLSVCHKLATALGGSITAQSTLGGEFVVSLYLPAAESAVEHSVASAVR